MSQKIRFSSKHKPDFITTLRKRVNGYFKEKSLSKHANTAMKWKIAFFLFMMVGLYSSVFLLDFSIGLNLAVWSVLGLFSAFTAVNLCHDAIHGALFKKAKHNKIFAYLFNVLGANAYVWSITHNQAHHTYTNIQGHDEDIESVPVLRMSPHQKLMKIHKHQYWYAFLFYGLATLSWVFIKDYVKFFQGAVGSIENKKHPKGEYFNLFFFKAVYYILFLVLPLVFVEMPWYLILAGFFLMHFFEGFALAIIFMLAHLVEEAQFPLPDEGGKIENAWAIHQLHTTADFARDSWLVSFLCGGLNFQIEHHLFPNICHIHYKPLSEIVEKTAKEYDIPYLENDSFGGAVASHVRLLKALGENEKLPEFKKAS